MFSPCLTKKHTMLDIDYTYSFMPPSFITTLAYMSTHAHINYIHTHLYVLSRYFIMTAKRKGTKLMLMQPSILANVMINVKLVNVMALLLRSGCSDREANDFGGDRSE